MNAAIFHPIAASNFANRFDVLFYTLLTLTVVFGGGVIFFAVYWSVKYRAGSPVHRKRPEHENKRLETIMIGVPLVIGLAIFVWGFVDYADERTPPPNATEIFVIGKQWMWHIQHTNGAREMNNLTVPVGRPIRLTMVSQDVIHELFIPAFRIQYQVLPGTYTAQWFTATKIGRYVFLCNQYCGMNHSQMFGFVNVVSQADYDHWLIRNARPGFPADKPIVQAGKDEFQSLSCVSCHGASDTAQGPSLIGIYNTTQRMAAGGAQNADESFIRQAIVSPGEHVVAGYTSTMPTYNELDESQLWALVAYVRSLKSPSQLPKVEATAPALKGAS